MSLEEFNALLSRHEYHLDMLEHFAALSPWAIVNVNRNKDAPVMPLDDFMVRRKARTGVDRGRVQDQSYGRPAVLLAPVPATGSRFALPGERPPSKYAPGQGDPIIARLDAWAVATGKVS